MASEIGGSHLKHEDNDMPVIITYSNLKQYPLKNIILSFILGDPKRLSASKKDKRSANSTSWYAECGLFKANEQYKPETNGNGKERTSSTSW